MFKKYNVLLLSLLFAILLSSCSAEKTHVRGECSLEYSESPNFSFNSIWQGELATEEVLSFGCIRDAKTAVGFADVIFNSVFGNDYNSYQLPLVVSFDEDEELWKVETQLPTDPLIRGGTSTVIFRKSNAEVVAIWAEK